MKVLVITLLAILNPAAVAAVTEATVVSSGLCIQPKVEERYEVPQSAAGFSTIGSLVITKETDTVPLTRGIGFGFTWRAEGLPPKVVVTYRVEHPEITRPDGTQVRSYEENIEHQTQKGVLQTTDCYALGEPYELVKGDWKLTIMYKGEVIVSQTFHIVDQSQ